MRVFLSICILAFAATGEAFAAVTYRAAITALPATFDPARTTDTDSSTIILQLFDTLLLRNSTDEISPALAASYEMSENRTEYRFRLRPGIFFHDGRPITSRDVAASLTRAIRLHALTNSDAEIIVGVAAFLKKKSPTVSGIRVVSDSEFHVQLAEPYPRFLQTLADVRLSIVPENFDPKNVVGSGPFRLKNVGTGTVTLTRFDRYWHQKTAIDTIVFRVVKNAEDAQKLLAAHELDNSHPFPFTPPANDTFWTEYSYIHASVRFLGFNAAAKPFDHPDVRKALVSVLPIEAIHRTLNAGNSFPISHFVPYGLPGYINEPWKAPLALAEARAILKRTRWKEPIQLVNYLPDEDLKKAAETICGVWRGEGVRCQVLQVSLSEYVAREDRGLNKVFIAKLMPHVPDPYQLLAYFGSRSKIRFFNLKDTEIDQWLNEALHSATPSQTAQFYEKINRRIAAHAVALPLRYMGRQKHVINRAFKMPPVDVCGPYFQRLEDIRLVGKSSP